MSTADEAARAEAERQYPESEYTSFGLIAALHEAFGAGAAWQRPQPIELTDAMVEVAAEAIWDTQWRRAVSLGVRERAQPWSGASIRVTAGIREDARAALTAALNTLKEDNR